MNFDFLFRRREATGPNLENEVERGSEASRLMADPAFQRATRSVREGIHQTWAQSPVDDLEGQMKLRLLLKLLDDLEGNIVNEYNGGKLAGKQLEFEAKQKERASKKK